MMCDVNGRRRWVAAQPITLSNALCLADVLAHAHHVARGGEERRRVQAARAREHSLRRTQCVGERGQQCGLHRQRILADRVL